MTSLKRYIKLRKEIQEARALCEWEQVGFLQRKLSEIKL